jgi:hypothetical protein
MRATCPDLLIALYLIISLLWVTESSSLCSFLHSSVTSSHLGPGSSAPCIYTPSIYVSVGYLGCNAVLTCRQIPTFRKNMLPPISGRNMEKIRSSERLISAYKSMQLYNPKDQIEILPSRGSKILHSQPIFFLRLRRQFLHLPVHNPTSNNLSYLYLMYMFLRPCYTIKIIG